MSEPSSIQESQNLSMFLANHNKITQVGQTKPTLKQPINSKLLEDWFKKKNKKKHWEEHTQTVTKVVPKQQIASYQQAPFFLQEMCPRKENPQ